MRPYLLAVALSLLALAACAGEVSGDPDGADRDADSGGDADSDGDGDGDGDSDSDEDSGPWEGWIGSPCRDVSDCPYDGAVCLGDLPEGLCTQPCDRLCPDREGFPVTFCGDTAALPPELGDLGVGACLSRCDYGEFPASGCREGYGCTSVPRAGEPETERSICVPGEESDPLTDCQRELAALSVSFEPSTLEDEHPSGLPDLTCHVEDPVIVHSPVHGVELHDIDGSTTDAVLASCAMALALVESVDGVARSGVVAVRHYGTYNCRVIAGTSTLSRHAYGDAIDFYGFEFDDGRLYTLVDDWEHDTTTFETDAGRWLYDTGRGWYDDLVWNIVLTPNYNADHDDHFHVDLTPDSHFFTAFGLPGADGRYFGPAPYDD